VVYRPEVAEVGVPKTLRGIVAARVARLGTMERQLLSIAAVVGPRFSPDVLAKVATVDASTVSRALGVLEARGIVVRQSSGEYVFAHDLVSEVLRDGLTIEGGKQLHGAVAGALEQLYPQRVDELAERLADHWRKAGDRNKAVDYLVRACDRLENEQALDGAVANLGRAIELLAQMQGADRDRLLALYRRLGELSFRSRDLDEGALKMAKALELAEDLGRDEYVARFAMMRGRLLVNANRFEEGRKWLERAREVGRQLGNRELLRDITLATAEGASKNGLYASAAILLEEALGLSRDTGDLQSQIRCLLPLSLAVAATGDGVKALDHLEEARQLAGIHPDRYTDCELLKTEALIHYYLRNHEGTVAASSRALELAKEYGFWYEAAVNSHNLGEGYLRLDDYKRAFASLRYSYELAKEHGLSRVEYMNLRVLGFIDAVRFGSLEGRRRIAEAADYAQTQGFHWDYVQSLHLLGIADSAMGDIESARKAFRECLRLASEQNDTRYREDAEAALRALDAGEPVPLPR
jgi:tetratricopeptide (TPR) repeat protein